jgi:type IV pilus assembly protein PilE
MRRPSVHCRHALGFTLIELMIAVAIVAIIASVAYPAYTENVQRSRLAGATSALSTTRVQLEQFFQDNRNYGSTSSACGVAMPTVAHFTLGCNHGSGGTSQGFLITATGTGSMTGYVYTVDHDNRQRTTAFPGGSVPAECWLQRRGATC